MIDVEKHFKKVISKQELDRLQNIAIFQNPNGSYDVFNSYVINKTSNGITVELYNGDIINTFCNMKNAICWCIFDKQYKVAVANRVVELDLKLSAIDVSLHMHQKLFKKTKDADNRMIYLAKLNEDKFRKRQMTSELDAYISESNYWQQKRYQLKTDNKSQK
jgi:hypothetical protein